jgi:diguanylate cyclase
MSEVGAIAVIAMNSRKMNSKFFQWRKSGKISSLLENIARLFAWPLAAFVLAAAGWGVLLSSLNNERNKIDAASLKEAQTLSKAYSDHLSQTMDAIDQIILHVRYEWEITDGRLRLETIKEKGLFPSGSIFRVAIADLNGEILTRTYKATAAREGNLSDRKYFFAQKQSHTDALFVDAPVFERSSGTSRIRFSRRLSGTDGTFAGVVLVNIPSGYLAENYDTTIFGKNGFLGIVGEDGLVRVARIGGTMQPPQSPALTAVPDFARQSGDAILAGSRWFSDQRTRYVGWHPVKGYPLIAVAGLDEQDALASYLANREISIRNATMATAALIIFACASMALSARLAAKKHQLVLNQIAYRRATEEGSEGFYIDQPIYDKQGNLVDFVTIDCNTKGAAFYQLSREQLIGRKISSLYNAIEFPRVMKSLCQAMELGFYENELEVPGGGAFTARWINLKIVRSDDNLALTISDITETKTHAAELERRINQDALTGLPNRHWLQAMLPKEIAVAERNKKLLALILIDINGFKTVNDMFDHKTGDELLCDVTRRLKVLTRPNDHVVRLSSDEFLVIISSIEHVDYAVHVAQCILDSFKASFKLSGGTVKVGASIGISLFPNDGSNAETLLQNANIAMYSAKTIENGGYRFFEPHFHEALRARFEKETELKHAIEHDEFVMYYQPRIDISTGQICSMEALIRWRHPTKGLLGPLDFIPLAEETGLVVSIGQIVIEKVCSQVAEWAQSRREMIPVSINVSARQFNQTDIVAIFSAALLRHNIDPALIEIEVTESSMMGQNRDFSAVFSAIQKMGIGSRQLSWPVGVNYLGR